MNSRVMLNYFGRKMCQGLWEKPCGPGGCWGRPDLGSHSSEVPVVDLLLLKLLGHARAKGSMAAQLCVVWGVLPRAYPGVCLFIPPLILWSVLAALFLLCCCCCCCCVVLNHVLLFVTPWTVHARFVCPWDFPGKNTGVGCHSLLQKIFPTQGLRPGLLHWLVDSLPFEPPGKPLTLHKYLSAQTRSSGFCGLEPRTMINTPPLGGMPLPAVGFFL